VIFKPKRGSILQFSRIIHFLEAALATSLAGHLWNYQGAAIGGFSVIVMGFLWEVGNKYFIPGNHRFGDAIDFWAFVSGALTAGMVYIVLFHK
jgi:hypothetical protein